jgi:Protein of unknown function (DUF3987)/Bifunctional DNA primase/polymerase, N-terminal
MSDDAVTENQPLCLKAALDYAKRGFSVILLNGIVLGQCTCGKADCDKPGKHPIGSWKAAQTERASPEKLEEDFRRHPHANVGIVTGAVSGVVVVDIDGPDGVTSLRKILDEPPKLPSVRTGNGHHLYGRHPGTALKNFVKTYPGLDGRADGGYVVAPPSRHVSGKDYIWGSPLENPLPELPPELLSLFSSSGEQREPSPKRKPRGDDADPISAIEVPARRVPAEVRTYVERALAAECDIVAAAPIGEQEATLSAAGLKIGRYVGAGPLDFGTGRDALVAAGLLMVNAPLRAHWTRAEITAKVTDKLREGMRTPKWGRDPRGENEDKSPPLDIFGDTALAGVPVFPLDALPDALADFVRDRAERLGVDPALIAMPALAVCAAVLDDRHVIQVRQYDDQWTESARLWIAIIEEPGGKKTPAIHAALAPAQDIENGWYNEDLPKQAAYVLHQEAFHEDVKKYAKMTELDRLFTCPTEPAKPALRRLTVTDTTTEQLARILADNPGGVIGYFDELAGLLGSFDAYRGTKTGGRDRANWLELYNGGQRLIDRVTSGHLRVPNWGACVVGGIQPARMRKLSPDLAEDGLLQRFIPIFGSGPSRGIDRPANQEADRAYRDLLGKMLDWRSLPAVRVTMSPEAHQARERVMERVEALLTLPDTPGPLKNHLNKWEALFARLALTVHAVDVASLGWFTLGDDNIIDGETARRVEKLMMEYLLPNAMRFYGEFYGRDEHVQHSCWIADHILAHRLPLVTARDIGRVYNALRDRLDLDRAMSYLEIAGWIVPITDGNARRASRWWIDPRVHQLFAERAVQERVRRQKEMEKIREATAKLRQAA